MSRMVRIAAAAFAIPAAALAGQQPSLPGLAAPPPATASTFLHLAGRVARPERRPPATGPVAPHAMAGVRVVLHRVANDTAGPIDSVRTGADGRYAFTFRARGSTDAVYFASVTYAGIAYFTPPVRAVSIGEADGDLTVFDTTSRSFPLTVRGRHLVIASPTDTRSRTVVEVYEIDNDSAVTLVTASRADAPPTFTSILPAGAANFRVGQGDLSAEVVRFSGGRALVYAPFAPGVKQFSFAYDLPASAFPASLPLERRTAFLEILTEESDARVTGAGLAVEYPVRVEGRVLFRLVARDAAASGVVRIEFPGVAMSRRPLLLAGLLAVLGAAMLLAFTRAVGRGRLAGGAGAAGEDPERLARRIADLDAEFARQRAPDDAAREAYQRRRDDMKRQLTDLLARRSGTG
jgi:hypothetical protein